MRWRVVVPLVVAAAVTGGAAWFVVNRDHSPAQHKVVATSAPTRPPVLAALGTTAVVPTKEAVAAVMAPALHTLPAGELLGGLVIDATTGTTLWARKPLVAAPPASTLKLVTAAVALRTLGPSFRFTTTTCLSGHTVYLVGGGDPTLVTSSSSDDAPAAYPKPATLTDLAAETARSLPAGQPVKLRADVSKWSGPALADGWSADYVNEGDVTPPSPLELDGGRLRPAEFDSPRTPDPATQALDAFADLLRKDGVTVTGATTLGAAPAAAAQLAAVSSPPLDALVQRMLTDSDNDLAEALGRAVALHDHLPATFTGAAGAIASDVEASGVPADELTLHDTSGLSHLDAVAPGALVTVLRAAVTDAALRPIVEGLPVAGFTGTLADRYRGRHKAAGAGLVRAKTGSLTGVNALAGEVTDASGRLLIFALLASGTTETDAVQTSLDDLASALAELA